MKMKKKMIKIKDVKGLLYGMDNNNITKKEKLQMKIYNLYKEISSIKYRGAKWTFNLANGESVCTKLELSDKEKQKVEDLKAEIKQLEVELKLIAMEEDFEDMENE